MKKYHGMLKTKKLSGKLGNITLTNMVQRDPFEDLKVFLAAGKQTVFGFSLPLFLLRRKSMSVKYITLLMSKSLTFLKSQMFLNGFSKITLNS